MIEEFAVSGKPAYAVKITQKHQNIYISICPIGGRIRRKKARFFINLLKYLFKAWPLGPGL
jgi:hypothetical protein